MHSSTCSYPVVPLSFAEKAFFPHWVILAALLKINKNEDVLLGSRFYPTDPEVYHASISLFWLPCIVAHFKNQKVCSTLFFYKTVWPQGSLHFLVNLKISFSTSAKAVGILIDTALKVWLVLGEYCYLNNIKHWKRGPCWGSTAILTISNTESVSRVGEALPS